MPIGVDGKAYSGSVVMSAAMPFLLVWLRSLRVEADKWTCSQSIALVLGGEGQPAPYWRALVELG